MAWTEFHITVSAEHADSLSHQLSLLGAEAVTFKDAGDQPLYEPAPDTARVWNETVVIGLFGHEQPVAPLVNYLEEQRDLGTIKHFRVEKIEDEDWVRRSLDQFKPLQFGSRLWICPSWIDSPDPAKVNVILDPGLAFGTGTHPTTALCLEWLDANIHSQPLVIDYGCGSGILALAALKLGAKEVRAVDNDPQALEATARNGEQNGLCSPVLTTYLPNELPHQQADLIIANILARPLIELAPVFAELVKIGGKILLSGILNVQTEEVIQAYSRWFLMQPAVYKEEWARLEGTRIESS